MFKLIVNIFVFMTYATTTLMASCTMEKVIRQSGRFSNEGVKVGLQIGISSPEHCDNETMAIKRCEKLNSRFYRNFRTLEGDCNNLDYPQYGSVRSKLSRLLPADHSKFNKSTFFDRPSDDVCSQTNCHESCRRESESLPNPRLVSSTVSGDESHVDSKLTQMAIFFGQFLGFPNTKRCSKCCSS